MPTYSSEFAEALVPSIYQHVIRGASTIRSLIPFLYNVQDSTRAWEEIVSVGVYDPAPLDEYEGTGQIGEFDNRKGYSLRLTHKEYTANIILERKMVDDGALDEMAFLPAMQAGIAVARHRERLALAPFNNAVEMGAEHLLPDGKPLLATGRPAGPSNTSKTWANTPGTPANLTASTLEAARVAMMLQIDDRGGLYEAMADSILVAPGNQKAAWQLSNSLVATEALSAGESTTVARDIASFESSRGYNVLVSPYLKESKFWFLLDTTMKNMSSFWFNRVAPEIRFEPSKSNQVQLCYSVYTRWSYGIADARWLYGHAKS